MNIYVANIAFKATESKLKELFEQYGEVTSVKIITDRNTGRSKGFAFVEMTDDEGGQKAVNELNGKDYLDRPLVVNVARPQEDRPRR